MIFSSISDHIRRDLGQILMELARSWQIRPNLSVGGKAQNSTGRFDEYFGSVSGYIFYHMKFLSWVLVGHKLDLARPIDSPRWGERGQEEKKMIWEREQKNNFDGFIFTIGFYVWHVSLILIKMGENGRILNGRWAKTLFLTTQDPSY